MQTLGRAIRENPARWAAAWLGALFSMSCLGSNSEPPIDLTKYPDLGRTAVDPVTPGILGLSFDDGPSDFTRDIVDTLARHNAKATFFVVGRNIPGHRDVLKYERAQGHQVGNHSYYHEPQVLLSQSVFGQRVQAVKTNIDDADGGRLFFRFPYGAAGSDQLQWLADLDVHGGHYRPVGWNADTNDYTFNEGYPDKPFCPASVLGFETCATQANPFQDDLVGWSQFVVRYTGGGIVLFHDIAQITHDHLDEILTDFESPDRYWSSVPADRKSAYQSFYSCVGVDPMLRFEFRALTSGVWPSYAD
jgi:peptidoglycan/xylan/chitin deacetylase (PgdA/CDA1 family)